MANEPDNLSEAVVRQVTSRWVRAAPFENKRLDTGALKLMGTFLLSNTTSHG